MLNKDLKHEFQMTNDGDKYGNVTAWLFALCDFLSDFKQINPQNNEYEFKQSICGSDKEDYHYQILIEYLKDDLNELVINGTIKNPIIPQIKHFTDVLSRYHDNLERIGLSY